ncbi:MAG: hypothetical protein GY754_37550 [bacterium]|nr:hypothetical protein [bacterium]
MDKKTTVLMAAQFISLLIIACLVLERLSVEEGIIKVDTPYSKLYDITLAPGNSPENIKEYLDKLVKISSEDTDPGYNDRIIGKIKAIGPGNLSLLLDKRYSKWPFSFYAARAVASWCEGKHKDLIIKKLVLFPELISVVIKFGWMKDAKKILLRELSEGEKASYPDEWLYAVRSFNSQDSMNSLVVYFDRTFSIERVYAILATYDNINLDKIIFGKWNNKKLPDWQRNDLIPFALEHGISGAMDKAIDLYENTGSRYYKRNMSGHIRNYTGKLDVTANIIKWYRANKHRISFNRKSKQYEIN